MARVRLAGDCITFLCPGCGDHHTVPVPPHPRAWGWNGSVDRPTLTPSLLVRAGHFVEPHDPNDPCWCTYEKRFGKPSPFNCYRCHSFIKNGQIEFLSDCTHALAGKTVDLPEV